jgi:hypothetical protein
VHSLGEVNGDGLAVFIGASSTGTHAEVPAGLGAGEGREFGEEVSFWPLGCW